jgi:hypothetical protein
MEKNILAEIETFRGIEPEADIGEALRQLVKEVMRRSKQVRFYVFAFSFNFYLGETFSALFYFLCCNAELRNPEIRTWDLLCDPKWDIFTAWGVVILICQRGEK